MSSGESKAKFYDSVKAKFSALNETQDSIVSVAQWLMFHRTRAEWTADVWFQRLKDSQPGRRLNLIYVANEIVQQSKVRKKFEFMSAFAPMIAEASAIAYKGAPNDIQQKLRRVVEVWGQRLIWEPDVQTAIVAKIDELDKNRSTARKPMLGGSLFSSSSSAPPELEPLVPLQVAVSKAEVSQATAVSTSDMEYEKLTSNPAPTPPVHAARLSALLKNLASAENAVSESIKARRTLLEGLEKLVSDNRSKLVSEESKLTETTSRKASIDTKKREVEDGIMRGLATEDATLPHNSHAGPATPGLSNGNVAEPERPTMEELTPPPVESLTPVGSPKAPLATNADTSSTTTTFATQPQNQNNSNNNPAPTAEQPSYIPPSTSLPPTQQQQQPPPPPPPAAGSDILSSLRMPPTTTQIPVSRDPRLRPATNGGPGSPEQQQPTKRRKIAEDEFEGFGGGADAMADLDDDVAALLRAESGGG